MVWTKRATWPGVGGGGGGHSQSIQRRKTLKHSHGEGGHVAEGQVTGRFKTTDIEEEERAASHVNSNV